MEAADDEKAQGTDFVGWTVKQREALRLFKGGARNLLLAGGTRSGKTFAIVGKQIRQCLTYPGSRHLIARLRLAHAKSSVWHETLIPAAAGIALRYPGSVGINRSDRVVTFRHESGEVSEIWVDGLDEKERVDKILGREYASIFLNEVSQIAYDAVQTVQTRLAQKIPGLVNKLYCDCNPPSPTHWAHRAFIEKVNPISMEPWPRPELWASMAMNPSDNLENLPDGYMEDVLDQLPERKRARMRDGIWLKPEGAIYEHFDETTMVVPESELPPMEYYTTGVDFGLNSCAVLIGVAGDRYYVVDDYGGFHMTASSLNAEIMREWGDIGYVAYCDPSGGERIGEIYNGDLAENAVEPGLDFVQTLIESDLFRVCEKATGVIGTINDYKRDDRGRVLKVDDHYMDAMRYGLYSDAVNGGVGAVWIG